MKHIFFTIVGFFCCLAIYAQNPISRDFPTGTLGVTTRTEAIQNMLAIGANITSYSDSVIVFEGNFLVQKCVMNVCRAMFLNGKLFSVSLADTVGLKNSENLVELEKTLKTEFGQTGKDGMDDMMVSFLIYQMQAHADSAVNFDIWSRVDDKTVFFLVKGERGFNMMSMDYEAMIASLTSSIGNALDATGPDYDEANAVKSVAGISFGGTKADVRAQLMRKYGTPFSDNEHEIQYSHISMGGNDYDFATFYFMYNPENKRNEFAAAVFQKSYTSYQEKEASYFFDGVATQYASKYTNENRKKEDHGDKFYTYGKVDKDGYFPIALSLEKSLSKGGDMRMYVIVSYFQYKLASLYNDEI